MHPYIKEIPYWVVGALTVASAIVGVWRGGRDGAVLGLMALAQFAIALILIDPLPLWLQVGEDVVGVLLAIALVLTGRNAWTIVAAATQVLAMATQALRFTVGLTIWEYYSAQQVWFLLLVLSVLVGSLASPRRAPSQSGG
jgi:hypothetical protein